MEKYKIKISIIGTAASLFLLDTDGHIMDKSEWIDNRDLAERILEKIEKFLKRNKISFKNISKFFFECDSPYYNKNEKEISALESMDSKGKCGFTSWQIGEITAKTLNFIEKKV